MGTLTILTIIFVSVQNLHEVSDQYGSMKWKNQKLKNTVLRSVWSFVYFYSNVNQY